MTTFNKIMKGFRKDEQSDNKELIRMCAQDIVNLFISRNLSIANVKDILETVSRHFDVSLLRVNCGSLFKKVLPDNETEIKETDV